MQKLAVKGRMMLRSVSERFRQGNQVQMISGMRGTYDALSFYCHENMVIVDQDDNVISSPLVRGDVVSLSADSMGYVKKVKRYTSVTNREREIITHENLRDIAAIVQGILFLFLGNLTPNIKKAPDTRSTNTIKIIMLCNTCHLRHINLLNISSDAPPYFNLSRSPSDILFS